MCWLTSLAPDLWLNRGVPAENTELSDPWRGCRHTEHVKSHPHDRPSALDAEAARRFT